MEPVNTGFETENESGWSATGDWRHYDNPALGGSPCYGIVVNPFRDTSGDLIYEGTLPDSDRIDLEFKSRYSSRNSNQDDLQIDIASSTSFPLPLQQ